MELELGLKLARVADEFNSADLHIAKDGAGPLFLSTESDASFDLTAYLRGYKKKNVKIEINDYGTQIVISGEKAIQESIFVDWKLHKKETEIRRFRKAFKIPDGVILDKIKAKFDEDESTVTVSMPKKEKGIRGFSIEEVPPALGTSESLQVADGKWWNDDASGKQVVENVAKLPNSDPEQTLRQKNDDDMPEQHEKFTGNKPTEENQGSERLSPTCSTTPINNNAEITESQIDHKQKSIPQESDAAEVVEERNNPTTVLEKETSEKQSEMDQEGEVKSSQGNEEGRPLDNKEEKGSFKICVPAIAGSAFLLSFVMFVIHYIKTKSTPGKKKE